VGDFAMDVSEGCAPQISVLLAQSRQRSKPFAIKYLIDLID
jgi:hypothetical protein